MADGSDLSSNVTQNMLGIYALGTQVKPLNGSLVYNVNPRNGCSNYTSATANFSVPWTALVIAEGCDFVIKAQNALDAGASSIIIGNYTGASENVLIHMSVPGVNIIAVSISNKDFNTLSAVASGSVVLSQTVVDEEGYLSTVSIANYTVFMGVASIIALVLLVGIITAIYVHSVRRRSMSVNSETTEKTLRAIRKEGLENLEEFSYRKPMKDDDPEDPDISFCGSCAVCIEDFVEDDKLRRLPCTHVFHRDCIDPWLIENSTCPYCKMDYITKTYPIFATTSENVQIARDTPVYVEIEDIGGVAARNVEETIINMNTLVQTTDTMNININDNTTMKEDGKSEHLMTGTGSGTKSDVCNIDTRAQFDSHMTGSDS
eukprot:CFRG6945T1